MVNLSLPSTPSSMGWRWWWLQNGWSLTRNSLHEITMNPYIWSCSKPRFPKKSQTYMKIPLNILKPGPLIGFLLGNLQIPSVVRPSGWHHHADCAAARHRRGHLGRREEIRGRRDARGRRAGEALQDVAGTWYHHFEWDWHAFLRWDTQM